ncbi:MAG: hypothetical protein A2087_08685 [Spirochaetes bacterium GWD1_61_31]|nr:MAG: hypothetical protein A2Y37_13060 [Spirochaetes bacterium GWB1_60_80]OHD32787.1 MAG: hypothetical protein A2004_11030 [Spirochaetes bacterium GWC1_61_12]OHD35359.1 MAG: hypothetical protein A2087_08685 [Spirochaetes bacterium GWD1_61_31]OHD42482.1 MAG: hypothetical protein A2Y35_07855 [Spirochaetes bacterium GWE1_60_18]OHD58210.1 MAG: hypothetical protein A2Y32_04770 [Spirochaetes bacterium GWF1_60_12]HAP42934.1 hypothetical protein [Spirochaetaceae bacterium]
MASYYYFAATLPSLSQWTPVPFSHAEFLERASHFLKPADFATLAAASLFVPDDGATPRPAARLKLLTQYYRWERGLRNELTRLRAARLQKPVEKHLKPGDIEWDALRVAQAAFAADNPLEGELLIEKERWQTIERLSVNRYFNMDYLAAYALKLQALLRRERFKAAEGEAGYRIVYDSVLKSADYRNQTGDTK